MYFSGQGSLFIAPFNTGSRIWTPLGNVPNLELSISVEKTEERKRYDASNDILRSIETSRDVDMSLTIEEFTKENLAAALRGTTATVPAGSDTQVLDTAAVGDLLSLESVLVSNVVLTDNAALTLTEGLHYEVDYQFGTVTLLDLTGVVQPIAAAFDTAEHDSNAILSIAQPRYSLRMHGINTAQSNAPVFVEIYKVEFEPAQELALINDGFAQFEINGRALKDTNRPTSADFGQFGRMVFLPT